MKDHLTLGSLFDGIGGWQLAAIHNGIEPIWSSEIEAFPIAVTKKHFPKTIQLGDITKLHGAEIQPVDIICAGSPCQDLSVANGNRKGLEGERSGLFMDAIKLVRDMRRASGGASPRYFVWENVPGAFSSNKGMDFRAVLEEIGQTSIPMPEGGKWANAGLAELPECEIAWRVLDAQHHVPQRRKRIFLVADFAAERRCAGEILLIGESVRGDSSESGEAGEGSAARAESGFGSAVGAVAFYGVGVENGIAGTLDASYYKGQGERQGTERTAVCVGNDQMHQDVSDKVGALNCMHDQQAVMYTDTVGALCADDHKGINSQYVDQDKCVIQKSVRRLTPTECERLQGLPDGYTLIDDKTCSDTARYRALGNGMTQPCADYVLRRIVGVWQNGREELNESNFASVRAQDFHDADR